MQERSVPDSAGIVRRDARSTGERSVLTSLLRGARLTCPACGKGAMFRRYLKVSDTCPACSEALHHHRAEHWVVVRGTARVTIGDMVQMLHENESIYLPIGTRHRLENPGKIDLELIEVQTGSYLGEDDIERIEDDYHRS